MPSTSRLGAVAVVYGLLLDDEASMRTRQLRMLGHRETQAVAQETERLSSQVAEVPSRIRLPLLDLAAPALRDLSDEQRSRPPSRITSSRIMSSRITAEGK